jgi:hypothetical protein
MVISLTERSNFFLYKYNVNKVLLLIPSIVNLWIDVTNCFLKVIVDGIMQDIKYLKETLHIFRKPRLILEG